MAWNNLDLKCALAAKAIFTRPHEKILRQEMEKLCTDAAAVLAENGPYAFFLFLQAYSVKGKKKENESAPFAIQQETFKLLSQEMGLTTNAPREEPWQSLITKVAKLSEDLNQLLLAKRLIMQTLNYARYHAKTLPKS